MIDKSKALFVIFMMFVPMLIAISFMSVNDQPMKRGIKCLVSNQCAPR